MQVGPYAILKEETQLMLRVKKFGKSMSFPNESLSRLTTVEFFMISGSQVNFPHTSMHIMNSLPTTFHHSDT